jgi:cytochrome c oxidase cbb3-type subunit I
MIAPTNPTIPLAALAPGAGPACAASGSTCGERTVLLTLLGSATLWLLAGSFLLLVASLKLVAPGLLADCAVASYGRVQPAAVNALLFGFATPAALAVALWLILRQGGGTLRFVGAALVGGLLWNLGVAVGLIEIFSGHTTGFEWLEMPKTAGGILLAGYLLVALSALQTLRARVEQALTVSQWFVVGALFAFPWLYSTAVALLQCLPVRGVVQVSVNAWFTAGFSHLWLGAVALAALYHFLPRLAGADTVNRSLALVGFWSLFLLGAWTGLQPGTPLPAWLVSLSGSLAVLLLVPLAANATNLLCNTRAALGPILADGPGRFALLAALAYLLWNLALVASALPAVSARLRFSPFESTKFLLGFVFVSSAFFGALYQIVPELLGRPWPLARALNLHWGLTVAALVLAFTAPWGSQFTAPLVIFLGAALFAANFALLAFACCRSACACDAWFVPETSTVRAGA